MFHRDGLGPPPDPPLAAQVKFLKALLHVKQQEIEGIRLEQRARDLELDLAKLQLEQQLAALTDVYHAVRESRLETLPPPAPPKRGFWARLRGKK